MKEELRPRLAELFRKGGPFYQGFNLMQNAIVVSLIGSASHNTYVPKDDPNCIDDVDIFIVVVPPPEVSLGLHNWEGCSVQHEELDIVVYSQRKFFRLLVKSNPNVLGTLWLPEHCYVSVDAHWWNLVTQRDMFSCRLGAYESFAGYAKGQLNKMTANACEGYMGAKRKALVEKFGYDCKNASHCIRLLRMGTEFLRTGVMKVWRDEDAQLLRDIKSGKWSLQSVQEEAARLFDLAREAKETSHLQDRVNVEEMNKLLVQNELSWWYCNDEI